MSLSASGRTLLDFARAEAKRSGHEDASLVHLAAVFAYRDRARFERVFGSGAADALKKQLRTPSSVSTEGGVEGFLEGVEADDAEAVLEALHQRGVVSLPRSDVGEVTEPDGLEPEADAQPAASDDEVGTPPPAGKGLLERVGPDQRIVGREPVVDELIALLGRHVPATPLLTGPPGAGKTAMAAALAARLAAPGYRGPLAGATVLRVRPSEVLVGNPVVALDRALNRAQRDIVIVVDDVEVITAMGSPAAILPMVARLRAAVEDPRARVVLVMEERFASRLEVVDEELADELTRVAIPPLSEEELERIAQRHALELADHHAVEVSAAAVRRALLPPGPREERRHPGLLIDRLDVGCTRAALRGDPTIDPEDVAVVKPEPSAAVADELAQRLRQRVRGQDDGIERICHRLAVTRARLDLRPERPDGVFLFVGPTGVGKTELARAVCAELFGDEERLVRLDMSEYAQEWALSRLIGPQPGYVGSTEPESWLTTRIRSEPETVLLLDEMEKAHPRVWNAFLQVFDAGRLSDSRGNVADFSRTVVVMTSNLGARGAPRLGFADELADGSAELAQAEHVMAAVRGAMPPELVNRLDEVIVFRPLSPATIHEIAAKETEALLVRLAARGYQVDMSDEVLRFLADTGYDPSYGARHLQRNIERLLLQPLASASARDLRATVEGERIVLRPT